MKLEIQHVSVEIQGKSIVRDIDLLVKQGEVVGLIGPNGSGKTTLLRAVYRVLQPSNGIIWLGEKELKKLSTKQSAKRTGIVIQEPPSDFDFTVREIVKMGRLPHKDWFAGDNSQDEAIVNDALTRVSMLEFAGRSFHMLSGGEKQRVLIARALAQQPRLLVMDEPTNHLDIRHQLEILELTRTIGITTIVTLHDLNLAYRYCDRLYVLHEGQMVAAGTPGEVIVPELIRTVYGVDLNIHQDPITGQKLLHFLTFEEDSSS
jgi:iron complex transport system ATP-binding protein